MIDSWGKCCSVAVCPVAPMLANAPMLVAMVSSLALAKYWARTAYIWARFCSWRVPLGLVRLSASRMWKKTRTDWAVPDISLCMVNDSPRSLSWD